MHPPLGGKTKAFHKSVGCWGRSEPSAWPLCRYRCDAAGLAGASKWFLWLRSVPARSQPSPCFPAELLSSPSHPRLRSSILEKRMCHILPASHVLTERGIAIYFALSLCYSKHMPVTQLNTLQASDSDRNVLVCNMTAWSVWNQDRDVKGMGWGLQPGGLAAGQQVECIFPTSWK